MVDAVTGGISSAHSPQTSCFDPGHQPSIAAPGVGTLVSTAAELCVLT